jgi:hypothetical protein
VPRYGAVALQGESALTAAPGFPAGIGPAVALLIAAFAVVPQASAQTVAEQRERVATLRDRLAALEAHEERRDSAVRAALRLDTLRVGGFTIVTDSGGSARLRAAAETAWAVVRQELEVTPETFRSRRVFVRLGRDVGDWTFHMQRGDQTVDGNASAAGLRSRFLAAAGSMAADPAGRRVGLWIGAALGLQHDRRDLRWRALVEMVTATAETGRACYGGDMAACGAALGIEWADTAFARNSPEERRRAVRELVRPADSITAALRDECLAPDGDYVCWQVLERSGLVGPAHRRTGYSSETASGVLRMAARLGGPGAFDRLVADTSAPLGERLEAMAAVPLDSVLRAWWSDARGVQRPPVRVPPRTQWVTVAWTLAFAAMALRISRWR